MGTEAKRYVSPLLERIWKNVFKYSYRLLHKMPVGQVAYQKWAAIKSHEKFVQFQSQIEKTNISYDMDSIVNNPPLFDIYMTGSDQTWNPRYYADDHSFYSISLLMISLKWLMPQVTELASFIHNILKFIVNT